MKNVTLAMVEAAVNAAIADAEAQGDNYYTPQYAAGCPSKVQQLASDIGLTTGELQAAMQEVYDKGIPLSEAEYILYYVIPKKYPMKKSAAYRPDGDAGWEDMERNEEIRRTLQVAIQ